MKKIFTLFLCTFVLFKVNAQINFQSITENAEKDNYPDLVQLENISILNEGITNDSRVGKIQASPKNFLNVSDGATHNAGLKTPQMSLAVCEREIIGASPFQDSLWTFSTVDWRILRRIGPTLAGFTITGINSISQNPSNGLYYAILKVAGVSGRVLATIVPQTGVCTQIGNLGDNFSSITFTPAGICYGVTGDGATVKETLYQINTTNANKTLLTPLGNGADGEVIAYNKDDGMIYHWSGNGTVVYEKIHPTTFAITNIPIIGSTNGETFGAVYDGNGVFITSNISSSFNTFTTGGAVSASFGSLPDDVRGLAFIDINISATISGTTVVCQNAPVSNVLFTGSGGTAPYTFTYHVNNGNLQTVTTTSGNSVSVSQATTVPGTFIYTLVSMSDANGCSQNQSGSVTITVSTKPTVTLSVNGQTFQEGDSQTICDADANPTNNSLVFNAVTGCTIGSLVWRTQIGAGAWSSWSAFPPQTQPSDNQFFRYQAACDAGCPATYTSAIEIKINYRASAPQNVSLVADATTVATVQSATICDVPGNAITFSATCAPGEILLYSVDGGEYNTVVPSQIPDGNFHNYRVRCRKADNTPSCLETESGVMSLKITTAPATPTASISPLSACNASSPFSGNSTCAANATLWYNAANDQLLPTLPATVPNTTVSFYARCRNEAGCLSEKSNTVTFTFTPVNNPPIITVSSDAVCTGTQVTISSNCPAGSTTVWNTGVTQSSFQVTFSSVNRQSYSAKCVFPNGCQSPVSALKEVIWKAFDLTIINIGQSQSAIKPANDRNLWSAQFVTPDAGPSLERSTQLSPTIYYTENLNKGTPRYWTIQVETCALGTDGSVTYNLLATPETGVAQSYNTHENNAPYLMYANREGWTELYAQNHPAYGFYQNNGNGGNTYDTGLPKGFYKLGIRYWDQKGQGSIYPSTRQPAGNVLAYQEYWFRIQSKNGIGSGAGRTASNNDQLSDRRTAMNNGQWAQVMPNPVSNTLHLKVNEAKGQKVNVSLVDASGRTLLQRAFVPQANQHQEEFEVEHLANGMYFLQVNTSEKQAVLKVLKVQ